VSKLIYIYLIDGVNESMQLLKHTMINPVSFTSAVLGLELFPIHSQHSQQIGTIELQVVILAPHYIQ
jgi:hypothetical protein